MFSHVWLFVTPWTVAPQVSLSMGFSRQEYWSGLLFPSPGHLPNPGVKFTSSESPALSDRFFTTEPLMGSPLRILEPIAVSFSRGSSRPRDWTCVSCIIRWILYHWATRILLQLTFFAQYHIMWLILVDMHSGNLLCFTVTWHSFVRGYHNELIHMMNF